MSFSLHRILSTSGFGSSVHPLYASLCEHVRVCASMCVCACERLASFVKRLYCDSVSVSLCVSVCAWAYVRLASAMLVQIAAIVDCYGATQPGVDLCTHHMELAINALQVTVTTPGSSAQEVPAFIWLRSFKRRNREGSKCLKRGTGGEYLVFDRCVLQREVFFNYCIAFLSLQSVWDILCLSSLQWLISYFGSRCAHGPVLLACLGITTITRPWRDEEAILFVFIGCVIRVGFHLCAAMSPTRGIDPCPVQMIEMTITQCNAISFAYMSVHAQDGSGTLKWYYNNFFMGYFIEIPWVFLFIHGYIPFHTSRHTLSRDDIPFYPCRVWRALQLNIRVPF